MVLEVALCLGALCSGVHPVVLLPAILWVVLHMGAQAVGHLGVLRCRTGRHLGRTDMSSSVAMCCIGVPISPGLAWGCFPCCAREVGDPHHSSSEAYRRLLCRQPRALPPCSQLALGDAGHVVHPRRCR